MSKISKRSVLCILFAAATLFLASCQKDIEVAPEPPAPVDMEREEIIAGTELQYPVEKSVFYYEVYGDKTNDGVGYVAITKYLGDRTLTMEDGVYTPPKHIIVPDTIDGLPVYVIGPDAFKGASIETIKISKNVVSIEAGAFVGCPNLKEVEFTDVIVDVKNCEEGTGVKSIGTSAFAECPNLTTIKLPDSLVKLGASAFAECVSLKEIVLPAALEELGSSAFSGCLSLKEITIPEYITEISSNVCYGCSKLADIYICDSVTSIESSAFAGVHTRAKIHGSPYSRSAHYAAEHFMLFSIQEKPIVDDAIANDEDPSDAIAD